VWERFQLTDYAEKKVQLVIIGCGSIKLGVSLASDLNAYNQPFFRIYSDPTREAYTALGLIHKTQFYCLSCMKGTVRALYQGITRCWCIWNSGDTKQNGGVFVLKGGTGESLFTHIDQTPSDHAQIDDIFKAADLTVKHTEEQAYKQ